LFANRPREMIVGLDAATQAETGAVALIRAAAELGAGVCFANPGTTEMPLVGALDQVPGVRAVLGLQENVCTGAADGYARMAGHPALTLLHLGPGLANGLANLHNARRAHSPIVNVVGDHASWHLPYDAPLTSDIAALAGTVGSVHTVRSRSSIAATTRTAIEAARDRPGVSTLIVPEDFQQAVDADPTEKVRPSGPNSPRPTTNRPTTIPVEIVAGELRKAGRAATILLGASALSRAGQSAAGRIAAATGARLYAETFPARAERGGGLSDIDRLPYFPEIAVAALKDSPLVVLAGAPEPIAYFGYDGVPSVLSQPGTLRVLAGVGDDAEARLLELADLVAVPAASGTVALPELPSRATVLTGASVGATLAALLPETSIVSIEGGTCGYPFYSAAAGAAAHTVLTNTGGAIGQGLPCALGAALAAPDRPVIALQSDGSGLYTAQALWTMAREGCDVVVLIAANHTYNVLRTELTRHGEREPGPQAASLTSLGNPRIDWVALSTGYGVEAARVESVGQLQDRFEASIRRPGPYLIEMAM
jgi:acetolactate synthase-1/2/3 large subunit